MQKTLQELLKRNRQAMFRIARANRAESLALFGSYARGTETPTSDIDLLVTFSPKATLFDHARLETELSELLGVSVDVVSAAVLKDDAFGRHVRQEAIAL